jgi:hypothetical protein
MKLRKIYYRIGIHKLMESIFNTFVIYFNLKLQIDNPLRVLLENLYNSGYLIVWSLLDILEGTLN